MSLIRASTLAAALQSSNPPRVLDCTWLLPNSQFSSVSTPDGAFTCAIEHFRKRRLPFSRFLDIDAMGDDAIAPGVPHNLPTEETFGKVMESLGIGVEKTVVIYDAFGVFSSPRGAPTAAAILLSVHGRLVYPEILWPPICGSASGRPASMGGRGVICSWRM